MGYKTHSSGYSKISTIKNLLATYRAKENSQCHTNGIVSLYE